METKRYLSLERLTEYDGLIKEKIDSGDSSTLSDANSYTDTKVSNITNGTIIVKEAEHATSANKSTSADSATNAESATKATQDGNGNVIVDTYETKTDAQTKLDNAKSYADSAAAAVKNDLLNGAGAAYDTLKELGDLIDENVDAIEALETVATNKMDKENPTGTGSFSLNRKADTTVGNYSVAEGYNTEASGEAAHAEGRNTTASGYSSHAEGEYTYATASFAHAEGTYTNATGGASHAEGWNTFAYGEGSHAEGQNTIASSDYQHTQGKYNIEDSSDVYAHIVGNGTSSKRSNAHTLDWDGNAWFAGNIYIGGTSQEDAMALTVATEDDINAMLAELDLSSAPTAYRIFDTIHMSDSTTGEVYEVTVSDGHLAIAEQTA